MKLPWLNGLAVATTFSLLLPGIGWAASKVSALSAKPKLAQVHRSLSPGGLELWMRSRSHAHGDLLDSRNVGRDPNTIDHMNAGRLSGQQYPLPAEQINRLDHMNIGITHLQSRVTPRVTKPHPVRRKALPH